jgi:two-component system, cell cycle response regulator DivK
MTTLLIIEDNDLNLKLARTILVGAGFSLLEATSAEDGLALARAHHPAVALMDIHLPGMDGMAALQILRTDEKTSDIKVLAITASAMRGDRERILSAGFDGYVSKPFGVQELLDAVRMMLSTGSP